MKAPTGQVTLVFTDVEGSTVLWEKLPDAMRQALDIHNQVMRTAIGEHKGYEVKTEGDAFMVAFSSPSAACRFSLAVQQRLLAAPWPPALLRRPEAAADVAGLFRGLRVRMGLHVGKPDCRPDPTNRRMDYFGPMVNRSARVSGAGHGGQILVTGEVMAELGELQAYDAVVTELGEHGLKGIDQPVRLFQILPSSLAARVFSPIKTLDVRRTNLDDDPTRFVGRQAELEAMAALVGHPGLVTVIGPGGMGKTRLARQVGRSLKTGFANGGVWFSDVSAAGTLDEFLTGVAESLGIPLAMQSGSDGHVDQIGRSLAVRGRLLLILDNVEQIVEVAARSIARWRNLAPEATLLVTSRLSLDVPGEQTFELEPLSPPQAVELFASRAGALHHAWSLEASGRGTVEQLVRRLDCIPLAIELAAARVKLFTPAQLLGRLSDRLDLLKSRDRQVLPRQATLRGTIDWSWHLLKPWQQMALARCSVFVGGFSFDALEQVVAPEIREADALDIAESLRHGSLLRQLGEDDGELRFGLFEAIRQYAAEKLGEMGQQETTARMHARYFLGEAEKRRGGNHVRFVARERENLFAIHHRHVACDWPLAARAVRIIISYLRNFCPTDLVQNLVDATISAAPADAAPVLLAPLFAARGNYRAWFGRRADAIADMTRARQLAQEGADPPTTASVWHADGMMQMMHGDMGASWQSFGRSLALVEGTTEHDLCSQTLESMALHAFFCGRLDEQLRFLTQALRLPSTEEGSLPWAGLQRSIGEAHLNLGHLVAAREFLERALPVTQRFDDRETGSHVERLLASLAMVEGALEEAAPRLERARMWARELCNHGHQAIVMRLRAVHFLLSGQPEAAIEELEASIPVVETCAIKPLQGPLYAFLGAAQAVAGRADQAGKSFATAGELLAGGALHWQQDALRVLQAISGPRDGTRDAALIRGEGLRQDSVDLVLARRVLAAALERKPA